MSDVNRPKVYGTDGGVGQVIQSGGYVDFESGAELRIAGTAVTATAAALNSGRNPVTAYAADGALTISNGTHKLTKAGVNAMTLAAPAVADEGIRMVITAQTANAHTVTLTEGFNNGGAAADVATFGGAIGDCMHIVAINQHWNVITLRNVTLG